MTPALRRGHPEAKPKDLMLINWILHFVQDDRLFAPWCCFANSPYGTDPYSFFIYMHKHRFYISPENIKNPVRGKASNGVNNTALITQPEYHHIVDVLRYKKGDSIILFDGKGNEYAGRIESINGKDKSLNISLEKSRKEELRRPLVLAQSLIKSANMDLIIQKATELGVTNIYPLNATNSVIRIEPKAQFAKINKWRRIIEEAGKQSGRSYLPEIDKVWNLNEALSSLDWVKTKIICTPSEKAIHLRDIPDISLSSTAVMIGPEGDFTDEELNIIRSKGWTPVHLGKTILRAETAAISVLGAICYKFRYWE